MMDDLELPQDERRALAELKLDLAAPADVEARIVGALRDRGIIRRRASPIRWAAAAAVLILAFSAGVWSGVRAARGSLAHGPRFVLLLYGGDSSAGSDRHREYATWARTLSSRGVDVDGEELATTQVDVPTSDSASAAPQAPVGYFIVSASTVEEARQIAVTCPHVQRGGRIVIRPIATPR